MSGTALIKFHCNVFTLTLTSFRLKVLKEQLNEFVIVESYMYAHY